MNRSIRARVPLSVRNGVVGLGLLLLQLAEERKVRELHQLALPALAVVRVDDLGEETVFVRVVEVQVAQRVAAGGINVQVRVGARTARALACVSIRCDDNVRMTRLMMM
jgi:hypothetical protein